MTKILLIACALVEAAAGLALLLLPAVAASLLLGAPLDTPTGVVAGRIAGAALFSLAIICWQVSNGERGGVATGAVSAMLVYNAAAAAILVYAGVRLKLHSTLLWPAIVLHWFLAAWCLVNLWLTRRKQATV
jgi:hypothetical protein